MITIKLSYVFKKSEHPVGSDVSIPIGVKKAKFSCNGHINLRYIGDVGGTPLNATNSLEFPIINGRSPNTFSVQFYSANVDQFIIFVEEIGGIPDPNYFLDRPTVIEEIISPDSTEQEVNNDAV